MDRSNSAVGNVNGSDVANDNNVPGNSPAEASSSANVHHLVCSPEPSFSSANQIPLATNAANQIPLATNAANQIPLATNAVMVASHSNDVTHQPGSSVSTYIPSMAVPINHVTYTPGNPSLHPPLNRSNTNGSDVQVVTESEVFNLVSLELQHANNQLNDLKRQNSSLKSRVNELEISLSTGIYISPFIDECFLLYL